ncbi:hypothetical protein B0J12DRAFT_625776 [Macrophomina phaseolina]|uniref:Methyltransferase domain-containing protein n=1 Tax=Macrophomina phaseolina TaxID=35725 RepID=A0ABQ8GAV1_9PEZI|nr:hypothetical protein B0J12DRAFT_625776 [Macrophomina phaseolina]
MSAQQINSASTDRNRLRPHLSQLDRLRTQHEWVKGSCGPLIKAPINYKAPRLRVLDSATADGFWLSDVKTILPDDAEFVGFDCASDLMPLEETIPANLKLVTHDLLQDFPAEWIASFDLVHQRFVMPHFAPEEAAAVVTRLVRCVRPGGWIQHVEPDATIVMCDSQAHTLSLLPTIFSNWMPDRNPSVQLVRELERNGVKNIQQQSFDVPIGKAHKDTEMGLRGRKNMLYMFEMVSRNLSAEKLGLSQERFANLYADAEKEIDEFGMCVRYVYTWGQKQ